ncbi:MAG TPA: toxin [Verrucomicrobiae bacterium]|jgi:hypothetical protein|nr:toxin [Verrucomicrobiae bacterium]
MEFFETPPFTRCLRDYLTDEEYRSLQYVLVQNPESGDIMPGTGGFRKMRWADQRRGKGRRGGLRIIYYYFAAEKQIWLMTLYGKDEADDLTVAEKNALRAAIAAESKTRKLKKERKAVVRRR